MVPYDIETNATFRGMRSAAVAFEDVAVGRRIMCLVCGITGIGKTLKAKRALRRHNVPFHEFGVTPSERDLVKLMWFITSGIITHRGRRILVVIADDQDGLARRETILNHLKGMFGSDRRRVTFPSSEALRNEEYKESESARDKAKYRATIAPPAFDIDIRLIWLSNLDYTDPAIIATLPSHFHAMVSKGLDPQCIPNDAAHDGRDVFLLTHYLATEKNSLGGEGYSYDVARAAVDFYVRNVHRLIDIPPRRLSMIAKVIKDNPDQADRNERLAQMLRSSDQRPKLILPEPWIPVLLWPDSPPQRTDAQHPEPQRDTDPPLVEPVPETQASQQDDPEPETPPSEDRDAVGAILDRELSVSLDGAERGEPTSKTMGPAPTSGAGMNVSVAPNADYEMLDDKKCMDYFGIPYSLPSLVPRALALRSLLDERVGQANVLNLTRGGYIKREDNKVSLNIHESAFDIAKIREVVDNAKAQVARAEADGFKIAEPTAFGAENHSVAYDLTLKALGLQRVVDGLKPLLDGGYLRIIGGMRMYHVERMRALMEKGRAARIPRNPVLSDPIDPPQADNPRNQLIGTVTLSQTMKDKIKDRWELKGLAGRVDPERRAVASENRFRAYHLIEMTDDDTFMDEAHKMLRDQGLRFWERVGEFTVNAALEIVKRSKQ